MSKINISLEKKEERHQWRTVFTLIFPLFLHYIIFLIIPLITLFIYSFYSGDSIFVL